MLVNKCTHMSKQNVKKIFLHSRGLLKLGLWIRLVVDPDEVDPEPGNTLGKKTNPTDKKKPDPTFKNNPDPT